MNFRVLLVSILLFQTSEYIRCQISKTNGYIISNTSDTIFGRIEYSANMGLWDKCVFIKDNTSEIIIYKPGQIQQFFISNLVRYVNKPVNGKQSFLKVLVEGKISLYESNSGLLISNNSDSLILLKGGNETFQKDGLSYSKKVETYKIQLRRCIKDTSYNQRIDRLYFQKANIIKLINEVDGTKDTQLINKKPKHKSGNEKYGLEFGYSTNTFIFNSADYNSTWSVSYDGKKLFKEDDSFYEDHLSFLFAGFSIKEKISATNSYLNLTIGYSQNLNVSSTRKGIVYKGIVFPSDGSTYYDTIGSITDRYSLRIKAISLYLSYYGEFSYSRIRPFLNLGISSSFFLERKSSLNREVVINKQNVQNELLNLDLIHPFSIGPEIKLGFRFLYNKNFSISTGVGFGHYLNNSPKENFLETVTKTFFVTFNF